MGFSGWSPEAVEFFQDLQADNTKAYWSAHKDLYEASVREPVAELLDELGEEFGPGRIARPYRNMRFRAGKSPYKTEIYATLDRGGYVRFVRLVRTRARCRRSTSVIAVDVQLIWRRSRAGLSADPGRQLASSASTTARRAPAAPTPLAEVGVPGLNAGRPGNSVAVPGGMYPRTSITDPNGAVNAAVAEPEVAESNWWLH